MAFMLNAASSRSCVKSVSWGRWCPDHAAPCCSTLKAACCNLNVRHQVLSHPVSASSGSSQTARRLAAATSAGATRRSAAVAAGLTMTSGLAAAAAVAVAGSGLALAAAAASGPGRGGGGGGGPASAKSLVSSGMEKFRSNQVEASMADFDAALRLSPELRPYLWQRGLSLYYLQQYQEGARQFRDDVAVNPSDTEEAIWAFLCEAQLLGAEKARQQFLQVGRDPRPVMRAAYECFKSGSEPESIAAAAAGGLARGGHDAFYAQLYIGLWHEAHGQADLARQAMLSALSTPYARLSGDYMASLARVHALRRGWPEPGGVDLT